MYFKNIETDRLILKNIDSGDRDFIFSQFTDDDINAYLFDAEPLRDISEADEIISYYTSPEPRAQHRWVLVRKSDGVKMGTCGFHGWNSKESVVEIGYDLKKEFWGSGYMHEALNAIIEFSRHSMNIKKISACIYFDNHNSIRLAEKLGFVMSDKIRYEVFRGEKYLHNIYLLDLN